MLRYQEKTISLRIWLMIGLLLSLCLTAHSERLPIRTYTSADGLAQDRVKRIVRDSRGFLWFCTADGLSRFDGYRFVTYDATQGLPFSSVNDLLETRAGVYWIASNGGGVFRFNPVASVQEAAATIKAGDQRPASTAVTENNQDDPRFTVYPVGDKSQTNRVNKLYEDEAGHNKDHLHDLTQRMRRFASDVFTARNIEFSLHTPGAEEDMQLGAEMRRQIFLIFKECVNNIVKHSGCTKADIEFRVEENWLVLKLSDNGRGFETTVRSDGHGLMSMRERAHKLGGELQVTAQPGAGTMITLKLPHGHRLRAPWKRLLPK